MDSQPTCFLQVTTTAGGSGRESRTPEVGWAESGGTPGLVGEGSCSPGLEEEGSGSPGLVGEGSCSPGLEEEGSGSPGLVGEGSCRPGLEEGSGSPRLVGEGSGSPDAVEKTCDGPEGGSDRKRSGKMVSSQRRVRRTGHPLARQTSSCGLESCPRAWERQSRESAPELLTPPPLPLRPGRSISDHRKPVLLPLFPTRCLGLRHLRALWKQWAWHHYLILLPQKQKVSLRHHFQL